MLLIKAKFLQILRPSFILGLVLSCLFFSAMSFADVDNLDQQNSDFPLQNTYQPSESNEAILSQNQDVIKSHLDSYLEKFSSKTPEFIKRFKENAGICNALTILWLCSKVDIQPEGANGYSSNWFKNTVAAIVALKGDEKPQD